MLTEAITNSEVQPPGYSIIRRDRRNAGRVRGGGVPIYFTSELSIVHSQSLLDVVLTTNKE